MYSSGGKKRINANYMTKVSRGGKGSAGIGKRKHGVGVAAKGLPRSPKR